MDTGTWPSIAVMGSGAVGCYYGGMLARAGATVTLIARPRHVDAIARAGGLQFDGLRFKERIAIVATTDVSAVRDADWVLFCVKSNDTEAAAQSIAPYLRPGAVLIGLQNGVDNPERIRLHVSNEVIAAVVYVAAAMPEPGLLRHTGRGDLIIGNVGKKASFTRAQLERVAGVFQRAEIPCAVSSNVEGELWLKLLMNCAYNAVSALGRSQYKRMAASPEILEVMRAAVREVLDVAHAAGVSLPPGDLVEAACRLADSMPGATSSTAQDLARGKRSEIDHLNGYIFHLGQSLGVPTPVNQTLHALVKLLEGAEPAAG